MYGSAFSFLSTICPDYLVGEGKMDPEALAERIRELCARAIMTPTAGIEPITTELQAALREACFVSPEHGCKVTFDH